MKMPRRQKYSITHIPPPQRNELPSPRASPRKCNLGTVVLWCGLIGGAVSLTFLFCFAYMSTGLAPVRKDLYRNLLPIVQQGNLRLYPSFLNPDSSSWTDHDFLIDLRLPEDLIRAAEAVDTVMSDYPTEFNSSSYTFCWTDRPSYDKPCFFDRNWLGREQCSRKTNYGYEEVDGEYNPCLILRLEETGTWTPAPEQKNSLPKLVQRNYDPNFAQVVCYGANSSRRNASGKITMHPQKGFPLFYFPESSFDSSLYLPASVAIKMEGLKKGENVTIECGLVAWNSLMLRNDGLLRIHFVAA